MPFREKLSWFYAASLSVIFGVFYAALLAGVFDASPMYALHHLFQAVIAFVALQIVFRVIATIMSPKEAKTPADERERLIHLKAARNAGYFLMAGVIAIPFSMHLVVLSIGEIGYFALAVLVLSEIFRALCAILYYRRDA
jgi:hypothetical protein